MKLSLSLCAFILCIKCKFTVQAPKGVDYKISVPDENVLKPCEEHPDNYIDKMFDLSNISYSYDDNENLLVSGTTKFFGDVVWNKDGKIIGDLQLFKKERGGWVSTPFNMYRPDLCKSIWDPSEIWYKITKIIPEKKRICPPKKGTVYDLDFVADMTLKNCPDRQAEGDYEAKLTMRYGAKPNEFVCVGFIGYIERL